MYIKVEPAEFFMYRVIMIFDLESPDSEDGAAHDYMNEWELEPKYQRVGDFEGHNSEFMQFGGCYLGKHLGKIAEIQRRHVEAELLTAEIDRLLQDPEHSPWLFPKTGEKKLSGSWWKPSIKTRPSRPPKAANWRLYWTRPR